LFLFFVHIVIILPESKMKAQKTLSRFYLVTASLALHYLITLLCNEGYEGTVS